MTSLQISTDKGQLDVPLIYQFLSEQSTWAIVAHPDLQGLRRFTLATADAHGLYAQFGFTPPVRPATLMERYCPDVYRS